MAYDKTFVTVLQNDEPSHAVVIMARNQPTSLQVWRLEPLGLKHKGFLTSFFLELDVKAAIMGTLVGTHAMTHPPHDLRVVVHAEETQNRFISIIAQPFG